jgi:protease I
VRYWWPMDGSDEEVVVDRGLVSSRKPQDIPAFNREMLAAFGKEASSADR